jgi:arylsulfatase A-like enzyme
MFTGLDATELSADYLEPLNDEPVTLAEALSRQGYVSGGFVSNYFFASRASGLARGFVHYSDYPLNADAISGSAWLPRRLRRRWNALRDDFRRLSHKTAEQVNRDFVAWLPRTEGRPFFAFLNYLDAHEPYDVPATFPARFARPGTRYWLGYNQRYTEAELAELRDHYDDAIAYMDDQIGRLLDTLDARGILRNTLIIVTSDHGEQFSEHAPRLVRHGWSLYSPALHVPMLLSLPDHAPQGVRVAAPVSIASIPATVLDLLPGADPTPMPGRSIARFWRQAGAASDTIVSLATVNPRETPPDGAPIANGPIHSLVAGRLHYIVNGDGEEELYDLAVDPWELLDLSRSAGFAAVLDTLRRELGERADSLSPFLPPH